MADNYRVVSVRMNDEMLELLDGLVLVYGTNRSRVINAAVIFHIEQRKADPELPSQIEKAKKRLDVLLKGS